MIADQKGEGKSLAVVRPKYYSVANAEAATGLSYRYVRDIARQLGVKVYALSNGRRLAIDADDFDTKLQAYQETQTSGAPEPEQDPTDRVLASLGLVRK